MVKSLESHFAQILHVHVFIHHDNALGKHRLSQRPNRIHHLARLAWVRLLDGNDHQVVKYAFQRQVDVREFGNRKLHQRQEDSFDCLAHPTIFHGRLADNRRGIDGILAMRDAGHVEDRVLVLQGVKPGVISKGTLRAQLVQMNVSFEDDFGGGRNFQVQGFAFHQLDRLLPQEPRNQVFLDIGWRRHDRRKRNCRISSNCHRDFHLPPRHVSIRPARPSGGSRHQVDGRGRSRSIARSGR